MARQALQDRNWSHQRGITDAPPPGMNNNHGQLGWYKCRMCEHVYGQRSALDIHVREEHHAPGDAFNRESMARPDRSGQSFELLDQIEHGGSSHESLTSAELNRQTLKDVQQECNEIRPSAEELISHEGMTNRESMVRLDRSSPSSGLLDQIEALEEVCKKSREALPSAEGLDPCERLTQAAQYANSRVDATKAYQCLLCPRSYKYQGNLYSHIRVKHEGKRHKCGLCYKTYTRRDTLEKHLRAVHGQGNKNDSNLAGGALDSNGKEAREKPNEQVEEAFEEVLMNNNEHPQKTLLEEAHEKPNEHVEKVLDEVLDDCDSPRALKICEDTDKSPEGTDTSQAEHVGSSHESLTSAELNRQTLKGVQRECNEIRLSGGELISHEGMINREPMVRLDRSSPSSELFDQIEALEELRKEGSGARSSAEGLDPCERLARAAQNADSRKEATMQYQCPLCPRSYRWKENLYCHIPVNHEGKGHKCGLCHKTYIRRKKLEKHLRVVHDKESKNDSNTNSVQLKCPMCPKSYTQITNLKNHIEAHHKGRRYRCQLCNRDYTRRSKLILHLKGVHGIDAKEAPDVRNGYFKVVFDEVLDGAHEQAEEAYKEVLDEHLEEAIEAHELDDSENDGIDSQAEHECSSHGSAEGDPMNVQALHNPVKAAHEHAKEQMEVAHEAPEACEEIGKEAAAQVECPSCKRRFGQAEDLNLHVKLIHEGIFL